MPAAETLDEFFELNDQEDEQMDASSLLPLMLQAQDLVAKLESRVVELENDLETINEAHEQERDQLLQEIGEKDEHIHSLKTKASRLEFGAREAIIVLARTVEILKAQNLDEDEERDDDDNATAVESTDFEGQFLDSIKLCLNYLKNAQTNQINQKVTKIYKKPPPSPLPPPPSSPISQPAPVRRDSKLQSSNDDDSDHKVDITTTPSQNDENDCLQDQEDQNDEINHRESNDTHDQNSERNDHHGHSRRGSFSGSQISLGDIPDLDEYDLDGSEDIADFAMSDDEDNQFKYHPTQRRRSMDSEEEEEERRRANAFSNFHDVPGDETDHDEDNQFKYHSVQRRGSMDSEEEEEERRRANAFSNSFHDVPDVDDNHDQNGEETEHDDDDETDEDDERHHNIHDLLPPSGPVPDVSNTNLCPNCNTLLSQVDQHIEERAYLKRDISTLAVSLTEEQTLRAQVQANKEALELEIDEWINAMFEKVNQMVFDEANSREELELLNRETKGKMENALKSSGSRQDRLRELKLLLVHLDSTKQRQAAPTQNGAPLNRNSVVRRSLMSNSPAHSPRSSRNFGYMSPSIFSNSSVEDVIFAKNKRIYIDGVVFEEFQEYIKSFTNTPTPNSSTPTHPFMKRCMSVDIQPCLFEGSSSWKSPFYKRRLLDAIMKNQCEIQTMLPSTANSIQSTPNTSQISNSTSNTRRSAYLEPPQAPTLKCGLCGHMRSCDYRMRLSGPDAAVPPTATMTPSSRFSVTGSPGWIPLDRFCRDRVVAVCDFYTYLSHLRQGLLVNSPVWGMYKQCLKYRRKMSLARVGGANSFEDEDNISNEYSNNSEVEGIVVIVH